MNNFFGEDFVKARSAWLYRIEPMQGVWRALAIAAIVFIIYNFLQVAFALVAASLVYHTDMESIKAAMVQTVGDPAASNAVRLIFVKSAMIGTFPAAVIATFLAVIVSQFGLPNKQGTLPLYWPKISTVGWVVILIGFWVLTELMSVGLLTALGVDAAKTGEVEKALLALAKEKSFFVLALPGAVLGAPLIEEVLFRGIMFAGLMNSPLGKRGAVLITAAVWAVAHALGAPWYYVLVLFVMGIVLGILLLRFGSLWVPIGCHTLWNLVVTLLLFQMGSGK